MEQLQLEQLAIATVYVWQGLVIRVRIVQLPMHVPKRQMEIHVRTEEVLVAQQETVFVNASVILVDPIAKQQMRAVAD